jgi:hypothetical protein
MFCFIHVWSGNEPASAAVLDEDDGAGARDADGVGDMDGSGGKIALSAAAAASWASSF